MTSAKILVADDMDSILKVRNALTGYEVLETLYLAEAKRLVIEDGIQLFLIGIHFDDSHAMDLIKFIRHDKKHADTPILVQRMIPSQNAEILRQTLNAMRSLQIVNDYVELADHKDADSTLRAAVEKLLSMEKIAAS
jgi:DNA-binding NtrC family response regulator